MTSFFRRRALKKALHLILESVKQFRSNDDAGSLGEAISHYSLLSNEILGAFKAEDVSPWTLEGRGWCNSSGRNALRNYLVKTDPNVRFGRIIRRDLVPLFGKKSISWGFTFSVTNALSALLHVESQLSGMSPARASKIAGLVQDDLRQLGNVAHHSVRFGQDTNSNLQGTLDAAEYSQKSVKPLRQFRAEILDNLDLFLDVVEATCDSKVALAILSCGSSREFLDKDWARLVLISNSLNPEEPRHGQFLGEDWSWHKFDLLSPLWKRPPPEHRNGILAPEAKHRLALEDVFWEDRISSVSKDIAVIRTAEIFGRGIIKVGSSIVDDDAAHRPPRGFVAGRWPFAVGSSSNLNHAVVCVPSARVLEVERAVHLVSRVGNNWFHWLIETLPKIAMIESRLDPDIPVLISDDVHPNGVAALRT